MKLSALLGSIHGKSDLDDADDKTQQIEILRLLQSCVWVGLVREWGASIQERLFGNFEAALKVRVGYDLGEGIE